MRDLIELATKVEALKRANNTLDVKCEVAMFKPNSVYTSCRANDALTKVIYTDRDGDNVTCWAEDHTLTPMNRKHTAKRLRAIAGEGE